MIPGQADYIQSRPEPQPHVTPKNAQIIMPLQGPNGALPRAGHKIGKAPARALVEFTDKRLGQPKSTNPHRQQYQLLKDRGNMYQNKLNKMHSEFKTELLKSQAYAGLAPQLTVDQTLQPGTFSGGKLIAQTDAAKRTSKLQEQPSPSPVSKVIQGIAPVLEQHNRKKSNQHTAEKALAAASAAEKAQSGLPPSSSGSMLQGFPLALQQEVRAYHQHHSNFSFMLK